MHMFGVEKVEKTVIVKISNSYLDASEKSSYIPQPSSTQYEGAEYGLTECCITVTYHLRLA